MTIQAKMRCVGNASQQWGNSVNENSRVVRLTPVYDSDPAHPNFAWSQATPAGYTELYITNREAFEAFEVGEEYLVTFAPVVECDNCKEAGEQGAVASS